MNARWIFILILSVAITSCENVNRRSSVPYVPVNYTLKITSEYPNFVIDNGFQTMTITQKRFEREYIGYAGLLIWVGMDNHYHAADLCCPHCIKNSKPVEVNGLYAICPICNEHFDLSYGFAFPTKGVTDETLRKYQTRIDNSFTGITLRILN